MKNLKNRAMILALLMCVFCVSNKGFAQFESAGLCRVVNSGNVVTVWAQSDSSGNQSVVGATGTTSTNPSTWTETVLSTSISSNENTNPTLFTNAAGDALVLWQWTDSSAIYYVAASILPYGAASWSTSTLTTSSEAAGFMDHTGSIDEQGNIMAMWTSASPDFSTTHVRGATAVITSGVASSWSSPFNVSQ